MIKLIAILKEVSRIRSSKYYRAFISFLMKDETLIVGDTWYIKNTGVSELVLVKIIGVTKKTVRLFRLYPTKTNTYKLEDVEFVEKTS